MYILDNSRILCARLETIGNKLLLGPNNNYISIKAIDNSGVFDLT